MIKVLKGAHQIFGVYEKKMADGGTGSGPRDAAVMESILKEMGVEEYEPNVVHQMLEFSYSE